ncbi:hypothetical protein ACFQ9X_47865 [Catenulispora yoronensis]
MRLVPALFGPAVRLLGRRRGVVGFVAAALSGRRVRVVAAPLAGLVVVVAAGMFAAGYDAAAAQKVRDDTLRQVGAAARIDAAPDLTVSVADQPAKDPTAYQLADGFAAAAANLPGVRGVLTARVEPGGVARSPPKACSRGRSPSSPWIPRCSGGPPPRPSPTAARAAARSRPAAGPAPPPRTARSPCWSPRAWPRGIRARCRCPNPPDRSRR